MKIAHTMQKKVHSCLPSDTMAKAAGLMWDHDVGCIPVVDGNGHPIGMITDRDICMSAYLGGRSLWTTHVADAMSKKLFTAEADQAIEEAEEIMRQAQVRRLPVVDADGKLTGIVSLADIARALPKGQTNGVGRVLGAISAPRSHPATPEAKAIRPAPTASAQPAAH